MNHQNIPDNSIRLDQYVVASLESVSRAFAAKLIEQGKVKVNGEVAEKASLKVRDRDKIVIDYDPNLAIKPAIIDIPVVYEDEDCVVINKPAGLLTHSKGAFNPEATVASWLSSRFGNMVGERAGIVHRLDRGTSGVMICAKNDLSQKWLQKQFATRKVKKAYIAIVTGKLKDSEAVIDMPIERNPKMPQTFRVGINGKSAVTAYRVLKANSKYSLLELKPTTGRTHQLRVHMSNLGHKIVGDDLYGGANADRLYLHAASLEISLPSKERKLFEVELPKEFNELMEQAND